MYIIRFCHVNFNHIYIKMPLERFIDFDHYFFFYSHLLIETLPLCYLCLNLTLKFKRGKMITKKKKRRQIFVFNDCLMQFYGRKVFFSSSSSSSLFPLNNRKTKKKQRNLYPPFFFFFPISVDSFSIVFLCGCVFFCFSLNSANTAKKKKTTTSAEFCSREFMLEKVVLNFLYRSISVLFWFCIIYRSSQ